MNALRETCKYSELFWSAFSRIRTEYGEIRSISPCSYPMRENVDQNNSEYGHLLCSDGYCSFLSTVQASSFNPCLLLIPLKTSENQRFQNGTLERKGLKKSLRIFPVIFFSDINPFVPSIPFRERMLWERIS